MTVTFSDRLRCFVSIRSASGVWLEFDLDDLDTLEQVSMEHLQGAIFAYVHIGFHSPDAQLLTFLATQFPSRTLLSSAARWTLPHLQSDGAEPIVSLGDPPVFLAGSWWRQQQRPHSGTEFDVWETEQHRNTMRFLSRTQDPPPLDISVSPLDRTVTIFATFLPLIPEWMLDAKLLDIPLNPRTLNCLHHAGIATLNDLYTRSYNQLAEIRNFGPKSAIDLVEGIAATCQEALTSESFITYVLSSGSVNQVSPLLSPTDEEEEQIQQSTENLESMMTSFRGSLSERESLILDMRYGFSSDPSTLQQVASKLGVSRERIRQIENKIISEFRLNQWQRTQRIEEEASKLFQAASVPIPLTAAHHANKWFENAQRYWYFLTKVVPENGFPLHELSIDCIRYASRIDEASLNAIIQTAKRWLETDSTIGISKERCFAVVQASIPSSASEFTSYIWEEASKNCYFVLVDGVETLVSVGRGAEPAVLAVLEASDTKLHYSVIQESILGDLGRDWEIRRVQNAAAEVSILLGRGSYGLRKHIPITDDRLREIATEAEIIARSSDNPNRQWHAQELVDLLESSEVIDEGEIDAYQLCFALGEVGTMQDLKRMVWTLDQTKVGPNDRVDRYQAVLSILEDAGEPLTMAEIRRRVGMYRGIGSTFQIWPDERIVKIDRSLWGLNPRDVVTPLEIQQAMLSFLEQRLAIAGVGFHISELIENFASLEQPTQTAYLLFSLASFHPRLNVSKGHYVYLREWGEPRRLTVRQAVNSVMEENPHGLTTIEVQNLVERKVRRSIDRLTILGSLNQDRFYFDGQAWRTSLENDE